MLFGVCRQMLRFIKIVPETVPRPQEPIRKVSQEYKFGTEGDYFPYMLSDLGNAHAQVASFSLFQVLLNHIYRKKKKHIQTTGKQNVSHK